MKAIEYLLLRFGLFVFFMLVTSPVAVIAGLLMESFDAREQLRSYRWIFVPILLAWLFGVPWLTSRAAAHMTFEDRPFRVAAKLAFDDLRFRLAFLPLIGHWFSGDTDGRHDDDRDA